MTITTGSINVVANRRPVIGLLLAILVFAALVWKPTPADDVNDRRPAQSALPGCRGTTQAAPRIRKLVPPPRVIRTSIDYWAAVQTSCGDFEIDLLERRAFESVNNFVYLARAGFYDGTRWAQVVFDFVLRGGDPNGAVGVPPDDAGYLLRGFKADKDRAYTYGTVAFVDMGNSSIGSQFIVVVHDFIGLLRGNPQPLKLDRSGPIFGRVTRETLNIPELISRFPGGTAGDEGDQPSIYIEQIRIRSNKSSS